MIIAGGSFWLLHVQSLHIQPQTRKCKPCSEGPSCVLRMASLMSQWKEILSIWNSLHSTTGVPWRLIHLWRRILKTLGNIPRWRAEIVRRSANKVADMLLTLGPPMEILFKSSLPIHILDLYSSKLCVQQLTQEITENQFKEQEVLAPKKNDKHLLFSEESFGINSSCSLA